MSKSLGVSPSGPGSTLQPQAASAAIPDAACRDRSADSALYLAERFHEAYERLAPSLGYETRVETRTFDPDSQNGRLMVAVCAEILGPPADLFDAVMERARASGDRWTTKMVFDALADAYAAGLGVR